MNNVIFKTYKDRKNLCESFGKNPHNYDNVREETHINQQKPIKIGGFNEAEEKEVKERVKK